MTTTAEGVETAQQQQLLRELGCSEMQGYLFSPPKPAAQIRELLAGHRRGPAAGAGTTRRRKPIARTA
jgi:EAL domain-containing protein (putative c-di-GMP-specific phosphodiesterase class I)